MSDILSEKLKWVKNHLDKDNPKQFPFKYIDLICEYFDKRANYYLGQQKATLGIMYIEKHTVQSFRGFEKQRTINEL